jgi:hypothetical protein
VLRNKAGPIAVTALPIQVFGAVAVLVALMIMIGVVPGREAVKVGVVIVVGGVFALTVVTLLLRLLVISRRHRSRS